MGKTSLARAICKSVNLTWNRVQFTPDLLPSDITGVTVFDQATSSFSFRPGPVFANIVLGDEINRASPKTQSALLEVMQEQTVSTDAAVYPVPRPFVVIATQNPIDLEGTYVLPEAQLDRFLMRLSVGYPSPEAEAEVLQDRTGLCHRRAPVRRHGARTPSCAMIEFVKRGGRGVPGHGALHRGHLRPHPGDARDPPRRVPAGRPGAAPGGPGRCRLRGPALRHPRRRAGHGRAHPGPPYGAAARRRDAGQDRGRSHHPRRPGRPRAPSSRPVGAVTRLGWGAGAAGLVLLAVGLAARWAPLLVLGAGLLALVAGGGGVRHALAQAPSRTGRRAPAGRKGATRDRRGPGDQPVLAGPVRPGRSSSAWAPRCSGPSSPACSRAETGLRTYRLPTSQRGTYSVGPVEIPKADPFGLCRRVTALGEPQVISVHPRALSLRPLPTGTSRNLEGPSSDTSPQGSVTFHRLREYVIGDDLRTVHWPSTARLGKLVVRHYVDTAQPYTVVLVDLRPEVYSPETFEEAMDVAASVATSMSWGKAPVQIRTTAGERVGGPGQRDPAPLVDYLTDVAPSPAGSLSAQLVPLRRDRGGSALVVVTGVLDVESLAGHRLHEPVRPRDRGFARAPPHAARPLTRG